MLKTKMDINHLYLYKDVFLILFVKDLFTTRCTSDLPCERVRHRETNVQSHETPITLSTRMLKMQKSNKDQNWSQNTAILL